MKKDIEVLFPGGKNNHIMVMKNAISREICEKAIFECKKNYLALFTQGPTIGGLDDSMKNAFDFEFHREACESRNIDFSPFRPFEIEITTGMYSAVTYYMQQYTQMWGLKGLHDTGYRIQHYPKNHGFYRTHHDGDQWSDSAMNKRVLGIVIYLNDVYFGGSTMFPEHNLSVPAKAGDIAVFPASWTHPHMGEICVSNEKWIVSSFIGCTRDFEYQTNIEHVAVLPNVLKSNQETMQDFSTNQT